MTIQSVLQIAIGRPISLPVSSEIYAGWMEMLSREFAKWQIAQERGIKYAGWFADYPEALEPYQAWLKNKPVEPTWTLQNHLDAIGDHYRAARAMVK